MSDKSTETGLACLGGVITLLSVVAILPIWLYLLGTVLTSVNATAATWTVFWVYVALSTILGLLRVVTEVLK